MAELNTTQLLGQFDGETGTEIKTYAEIPWREYLESKNYNHDINKMCELCIKDQKAKYGEITIKCKGLATKSLYIKPEEEHNFTEEDMDIMEQAANPYHWAERNIDVDKIDDPKRLFIPRWYQAQISQCLHEDTEISMGDGSYKKIKDIEVGDNVISYNEIKRTTPNNKVTNKWNNGVKPVYRIVLENEDYIDVTDNHPILTHFKDGEINTLFDCKSYKTTYKSIQDGLAVGMDIYTINKNPVFGTFKNTNIAKILGYLGTDGYVNLKKGTIQFCNTNKNYIDEYIDLVQSEFNCTVKLEIRPASTANGVSRKVSYFAHTTNAIKLKDFLVSIGCVDKDTREISILNFAYNHMSSEALAVFLNRAYSGDGCVYNKTDDDNITYSKISFAGQISNFIPSWRKLLRKIGIFSPRVSERNNKNGTGMVCEFSRTDDIITFFNFTGLIFGKEYQSQMALNAALLRTHGVKKAGKFKTSTRTKITSIEYIGDKQVYDIEVENRHNMIANGIIVHNCTSARKVIRCGRRAGKSYSLALNILHKVLTSKNYWVLIVTPYEVQSEEIINLILQFLFNINPEFGTYDDLVDSYKQSPNRTINFANGSRIKAFTTGSAGAASIRGQRADLIVIDEIDYITAKDFNSIIAILADKPHTELWTASTPDGEKQLYKLSKNKRYKEFHFPSFVLPHYNDELDSEFREATDETGFVQEIIAEFGTSKHGVFQKYYVDACTALKLEVTAEEMLAQRNEWIVTMGCDWNHDKVGTRILALAFNKAKRVFAIAEKATVSKEGWTQTMAMQKIIDLNRKWNFEHLYVDRGFGSTQIEILTKYGFDNFGILPIGHPDLKLSELKAIDFNSNVEIPDPYTGNPIKKHMKPFMVNNLNKIIEKKMIKFHPRVDAKLIEQLKGYEEKRGVTGRPTYKAASESVGDHDLDALMLAALAFNLEYSDLLNHGTLQMITVQRQQNAEPLERFTDIAAGRVKSLRPKSRDILFNRLQGIYNTESNSDSSLSRKTGMRARLKQGVFRRARF